jgi:hypothetical protein
VNPVADMSGIPDTHRYERKFAIEGVTLAEIEHHVRLHPCLFFPEFAPRTVNNIYFDSADLRNYRQNVDGHSERVKLRARWYGALFGAVPNAVLERKCKFGLLGSKQSASLVPFVFGEQTSAQSVQQWLGASSLPDDFRQEALHVEPSLVNRYRRLYFRSADRRVRLTIDSDLAFYRFHRRTNTFLARSEAAGLVVLELKYLDAAAEEASDVAAALPFRMTRMSKYVFGLNAVGTA